ncbi:hypothetical protein, partial [Micromonospora sp. NPDC048843]|uniref:hypothetical protein n=1 Tax=Micromonospora sp. NPDC048843 TaxID=3155389 RepID=UPI0033CCD4CF
MALRDAAMARVPAAAERGSAKTAETVPEARLVQSTGTDGQSATSSQPISVLYPTSTVGLLTMSNR